MSRLAKTRFEFWRTVYSHEKQPKVSEPNSRCFLFDHSITSYLVRMVYKINGREVGNIGFGLLGKSTQQRVGQQHRQKR